MDEEQETTPASRAGVLESEYRAWESGAKIPDSVRKAILAAAPNEPAYRIRLDEKGNPNGLEEFTPLPRKAKK